MNRYITNPPLDRIAHFGLTNGRLPIKPIGLYLRDRLQHMYVLGKTGTGKSTLLSTLFLQDVAHGNGCILLDPHGDLGQRLVANIPEDQRHRLLYLDLTRDAGSYGYNPLKNVEAKHIPLVASGLLDTLRQHFGEKAWGSRMEHILRNVLYALLEHKGATLPDILRVLSEKDYRAEVVKSVTNPQVLYFFKEEYAKLWGRNLSDAIAPIQNKVGAFLTDPKMRLFLVDFTEALSFRTIMDEGKILIVNLSRGALGTDTSSLLGSLLTQTISLAALSRPVHMRRPCFLYLDEFEYFLSPRAATMLSEVRKVGLGVVLANQYLHQLGSDIQAAVLGNVGSLVTFRLGPEDIPLVRRIYGEEVSGTDLLSLPNHNFYTSLLIEGEPSRVFSGVTVAPDIC
jgi:Type IV secretion-system coupling protein DNA-binding domain